MSNLSIEGHGSPGRYECNEINKNLNPLSRSKDILRLSILISLKMYGYLRSCSPLRLYKHTTIHPTLMTLPKHNHIKKITHLYSFFSDFFKTCHVNHLICLYHNWWFLNKRNFGTTDREHRIMVFPYRAAFALDFFHAIVFFPQAYWCHVHGNVHILIQQQQSHVVDLCNRVVLGMLHCFSHLKWCQCSL